jgi:kynurenine formamidase
MVKHLTSKHEAPSLNTSNTHTHTHTHTHARARTHKLTNVLAIPSLDVSLEK